jgi:hypothetical protein
MRRPAPRQWYPTTPILPSAVESSPALTRCTQGSGDGAPSAVAPERLNGEVVTPAECRAAR